MVEGYGNVFNLDIQIINIGGKIETDLYIKPTDKHLYLTYNSCDPWGCKDGIPFAQALRLRRICSTKFLMEHVVMMVRTQIQRAKEISRGIALITKKRDNQKRIHL